MAVPESQRIEIIANFCHLFLCHSHPNDVRDIPMDHLGGVDENLRATLEMPDRDRKSRLFGVARQSDLLVSRSIKLVHFLSLTYLIWLEPNDISV